MDEKQPRQWKKLIPYDRREWFTVVGEPKLDLDATLTSSGTTIVNQIVSASPTPTLFDAILPDQFSTISAALNAIFAKQDTAVLGFRPGTYAESATISIPSGKTAAFVSLVSSLPGPVGGSPVTITGMTLQPVGDLVLIGVILNSVNWGAANGSVTGINSRITFSGPHTGGAANLTMIGGSATFATATFNLSAILTGLRSLAFSGSGTTIVGPQFILTGSSILNFSAVTFGSPTVAPARKVIISDCHSGEPSGAGISITLNSIEYVYINNLLWTARLGGDATPVVQTSGSLGGGTTVKIHNSILSISSTATTPFNEIEVRGCTISGATIYAVSRIIFVENSITGSSNLAVSLNPIDQNCLTVAHSNPGITIT